MSRFHSSISSITTLHQILFLFIFVVALFKASLFCHFHSVQYHHCLSPCFCSFQLRLTQVIVKHLMEFTLFQFIPTKNFLATHLPIDFSPNFHSNCAWIGTEANKPLSKHQVFLFKSGVKEFRLTMGRGIPLSVQHRVHKLTLFYLSMGCCMPIVPSVHCFILFCVYSIIYCAFLV